MLKSGSMLNRLSRGLGLPSVSSLLPSPELKRVEGSPNLNKLRARILGALLRLADKDTQPMVSQLLTPILYSLNHTELRSGLDYVEQEIQKIRIDGLLNDDLGPSENREE